MRLSTKACEMMLSGQSFNDLFDSSVFQFLDKDGKVLSSDPRMENGTYRVSTVQVGNANGFRINSFVPGVYVEGSVSDIFSHLSGESFSVATDGEYTVANLAIKSGTIVEMEQPPGLWARVKDAVRGWMQ